MPYSTPSNTLTLFWLLLYKSIYEFKINALLFWFFSFKRLVGNWGYPVAGAMKDKKAIMSMTYGGNWFSIQTWFQNMPFSRIKAGVLKLGGMKLKYLRFYEVLPGMKEEKFKKHMLNVRKLAREL